jgi:hypothetical protein
VEVVAMPMLVEHVGVQEVTEGVATAPVGSPVLENVTAWAVPETRVAAILVEMDCPWVTDWFPPFEREKSKVEEVDPDGTSSILSAITTIVFV